jgi:serine/threonine protein phosphatase 1
MSHYIIGDIHGEYDTLMRLIEKLPSDAKLLFVGDLIDRGSKSAEVVKFVREGGFACVMGNHEEMMISYGSDFVSLVEQGKPIKTHSVWYSNGGIATLKSYGLIKLEEGKPVYIPGPKERLTVFKNDMRWISSLPLYIELDVVHPSGKPVVISHAPIATVWGMRNSEAMYKTFCEMALWNRREPDENAPIFNIFGHTVTPFGVEVQPHFVNVDTGCYMSEHGYGMLSAYCVETGEVVSQKRRI